jgi:hypothetical protein
MLIIVRVVWGGRTDWNVSTVMHEGCRKSTKYLRTRRELVAANSRLVRIESVAIGQHALVPEYARYMQSTRCDLVATTATTRIALCDRLGCFGGCGRVPEVRANKYLRTAGRALHW